MSSSARRSKAPLSGALEMTVEQRSTGQPGAAVPTWFLLVPHERDARAYIYFWGTYSLGGAAPSPKKYCSICLTMTS
jgi:hypothetical protein